MSKRDEQIARMKGLMTYGITNTSKKTPITESIEGPDGNVYAVIREGSKFYIKTTPKGSELVAESFNYIGGFMNKKNYEFSSYNQASKNLELKVRSLNEAYGVNKTVELLNPEKKEALVVEMTDSMKESLARYRQIMNNAAGIMNESSTISASNTGNPESPKTVAFSPKLGEPFVDTAEAVLDSDINIKANDPEKQGEPFGDTSKTEKYEDAKYVPDGSVANKKPSGGKVVKVNEGCEYEETVEECDEWGSCGVPEIGGIGEVGNDEPFTENISEDADSFVGFSDEKSISEDDSDNIDLDDIDLDLDSDSDETEDEPIDDIDDIDTEETLSNDEDKSEEELEIASLKKEIEELKALVQELVDEDEPEYEIEADVDSYEVDSDDFDEIEESRKYVKKLVESAVQLPFPIKKLRTSDLKDSRVRYGIGVRLEEIMKEKGGNDNDKKLLGIINGKLYEILQCEAEIKACIANGYTDDDAWMEIIATMESNLNIMNKAIHKLSFLNADNSLPIDRMLDKFNYFINKYSEYYDENINPDSQSYQDSESEDDVDDADDIDVDNIGFEDDDKMSDDEMDDAAWDNASDEFDPNEMDDMFDSVTPRKLNEEETKLNVFGKHPGYRKKPMTLPNTGTDYTSSGEDWNDESVYSEQPFGEKIGSSSPYEKIVNKTVESILESLKKKI
jgi:hypothetical protein